MLTSKKLSILERFVSKTNQNNNKIYVPTISRLQSGHGKQIPEIDLLSLFGSPEGEITQRYGRIGQGKTYGATADVLDELSRGRVVYTNWRINYDGFDQRESFLYIIGSLLFPWSNRFFKFPKENLHYLPIDENFLDTFSKLTDCSVYIDEGHVIFDSYEMAKMSMAKRVSVLHTRHFNRSINIISQRPTAIHVMMRANVNRFYKYDKLISKPFILFRRTEYQDMSGETVDEEKPLSTKFYLGRKSIYKAYDSKYLRGDLEDSQTVHVTGYKINYFVRFYMLIKQTLKMFKHSKKQTTLTK